MFGMGMPEMILILVVALIVIGPKKLPDLAKSLGRAMGEFKKATSDFKESMDVDDDIGDVKKAFNDINDNVKQAIDINSFGEVEKKEDLDLPYEKEINIYKTDPGTEDKSEAESGTEPEVKLEAKPEAKSETKPETTSDTDKE